MKFDELDQQMRVFETIHDHCVLPEIWMVARIDGRSFTRLTKEVVQFEAPFDVRFRDLMLQTVEHLMNCGFRIIYGYTQSDEISLLFHRDEDNFGRKTRKYNSVLAGEASAVFSVQLGQAAAFDCRICELPSAERVRDYFRWRQEDAHRNALNAHCYWLLRRQQVSAGEATTRLRGMSTSEKNELLFQSGVNFNDLPAWQKRGVGLYWQEYQKASRDPRTGEETQAVRRRIHRDLELPKGDEYGGFILQLVHGHSTRGGT
jgi:tRNA(His) guanylyltransferase